MRSVHPWIIRNMELLEIWNNFMALISILKITWQSKVGIKNWKGAVSSLAHTGLKLP